MSLHSLLSADSIQQIDRDSRRLGPRRTQDHPQQAKDNIPTWPT